MTFDSRDVLSKLSPVFSSPEVKRTLESMKQAAVVAESIDERPSLIGKHPSVRTNALLAEQKALAEEQLALLLEEIKASRSSAASTRRIAILANIIATIAAMMATIAAIPPIIELYAKFIAMTH